MQNIIIIGAGQAGFSAAAKLRKENFSGRIQIIGDESEPPYQRPPLSKNFLLGKLAKERLFLRKSNFYSDNNIDLITGTEVTAIDRAANSISTTAGDYQYDALILATGSRPRQLPAALGGDLPNVVTIRGIEDIVALQALLGKASHLLIVGGGYIGLEAAAVARQLGLDVTLLEAAPRILVRVACEETANLIRELHLLNGVQIHEATQLKSLQTQADSSDTVRLLVEMENADSRHTDSITVDVAIVGIGATATVDLARECGLEIDDSTGGIVTDATGRTSDESIWCAGDCSALTLGGEPTRLESVQNAIDQAENVALNILGQSISYEPVPWFWSDQFDIKLQIAGYNRGYDHVVVRPGAKPGACSHWYFARAGEAADYDHKLLAVDAINDAAAYMTGRRLLEAGKNLNAEDYGRLGDPEFDLKSLLGNT